MLTFEQWYQTSKYTQLIYDNSQIKQIALDAWNARQREFNILMDINIQSNLDLIRVSKRLEESERKLELCLSK